MSRSAKIKVRPDNDVVLRRKHARKRLIVKMKGVTETQAPQVAIPILVEALAGLRSCETENVMTVA